MKGFDNRIGQLTEIGAARRFNMRVKMMQVPVRTANMRRLFVIRFPWHRVK